MLSRNISGHWLVHFKSVQNGIKSSGFFPFSKSTNTNPSNLCISKILLISWNKAFVSYILKKWSVTQPPHYVTFLELEKPAQNNSDDSGLLCKSQSSCCPNGLYYGCKKPDPRELIPEWGERAPLCCAAQRMWFSKKSTQSQITQPCIADTILKTFFSGRSK